MLPSTFYPMLLALFHFTLDAPFCQYSGGQPPDLGVDNES